MPTTLSAHADSIQVGQMPKLDKWLGKNPYWPRFLYKFDDFSVAAGFSVERFMERMADPELGKDTKNFLSGFLAAKEEFPDLVTDNEVIGYMIINVSIPLHLTTRPRPFIPHFHPQNPVTAVQHTHTQPRNHPCLPRTQVLGGADTLAIVMKAIAYHILRTPHAHSTLAAELTAHIPSHPAPYRTLESLPYLSACISEGLRMHPVVGHIFERVVPSSGLALNDDKGTVLPPGTIVGVNPWVVQYDERVFGADAAVFRPERWMQGKGEDKEAFEARVARMREVDLAFGKGKRVCMGKALALVEIYKFIAAVFGKFEVSSNVSLSCVFFSWLRLPDRHHSSFDWLVC